MNRRLALRYVLLLFSAFLALFPVYWILMTSVQPPPEWLKTPPVWFTTDPTPLNYGMILGVDFGAQSGTESAYSVAETAVQPFINSLIIASAATVLSMALGTLTAWSISRFRVGGNNFAINLIAPRMFPPIAVALPLLIMYTNLDLLDSFIGLIIVYTGFTIPFSVWMTKSFIDETPVELEEAAMVDGLTRFETFYKITLPLIKPGIAATSLFIFILNWSDFLIARTLTQSMTTAPTYLSKLFAPSQGQLYGPQAAHAVIAIIPVILLGYLIYDDLARGFTFGAIHK
jgi:multiple sugar transport system permease protein